MRALPLALLLCTLGCNGGDSDSSVADDSGSDSGADTDTAAPTGTVEGTVSLGGDITCGDSDCSGLLRIEIFDGDFPPESTRLVQATFEDVDMTGDPVPYTIESPVGVVYVSAVLDLDGDNAMPVTGDLVQRFGLEVTVDEAQTVTQALTLDSRIP